MTALAVLVVDDNLDNRSLAIRMLKVIGVSSSDQAGNAAECLATVAAKRYDTILLDISMPEVSGIELCKMLRAMPALTGVRIIACTAHASPREAQQFQEMGFDGVLTKPFLMSDLKHALSPAAPPA